MILRDKPDVLHVRVIAPLEKRIEYLHAQGMSGIAEIKLRLKQQDQATAEYLKKFYDIKSDDPALYHLVINTGKLKVESAAQLIVHMVRQSAAALKSS